SVTVLRGVTARFEDGCTYAVMGRSGSGKSTLLSILGLLEPPGGGVYSVDGSDVAGLTDRGASRLRGQTFGFVFQRFYLVSHLTASENVELGLDQAGMSWGWRPRRSTVGAMLTAVGLDH